jgi:hypothetical protein
VQVKNLLERTIATQVHVAFADVAAPTVDQIGFADYASVDAEEMAAAWQGKHWTALTTRDVFVHRESIFALSAVGYRAYVAAFLVAGLSTEVHASDVRGYLLASLRPSERPERTERQRLQQSLLDDEQRAAIVAVLRHFVYAFREPDALEVLRARVS